MTKDKTLTYPDGTKYVGQVKDGKPHGQGTMYNSKGKVILKGTFEDGDYVGN